MGTSGFAYKEWKGSFYPEDLPDAAMLRYYAARFGAVEINNTFYRMPTESLLERWAGEVPDGFRFVIKAPRRITHVKKLADAGEDVSHLCRVSSTSLGEKLGPILFQTPPSLKVDVPRLEAFLDGIPRTMRVAMEFRHRSWLDDGVLERLRVRDVALCAMDAAEDDESFPLVATASWGYLRLRRVAYEEDDLRSWGTTIRSQPWQRAYVFFKHEDEATGPRLAARFLEVLPP